MIGLSRRSAFTLIALLPFSTHAQTFTGTGAAIPDNGDVLEIPLQVNGLGALDTIAFGLEQVCFTIEHTWISDLEVSIVAPDGTVGLLVASQGGDTDDYANTCFNADASTSILSASSPYAGTFRPQGQMGAVNNGQNANGTWHLRVYDTYAFADAGDVITWSITFGDQPASYFQFTAGDLPLLVINTNGQSIPADEKITGTMGIVDNGPALNHADDPFNGYDGYIGIELRGNSSLSMSPKKSFDMELRDFDGADLPVGILGMPAEADWVLSANYFDKSFLNNALTFHLARQMGRYAPRTRHVEVIINGEYQGVYVLMERIKQGPDRVDVAHLRPWDIAGDDVTGGYILSVDRNESGPDGFTSAFPAENGQNNFLRYRYPRPDDIVAEQSAYIQAFVDSFETALDGAQFLDPVNGYRAFADASSFMDLLLINEISRNVDGYRLSSYLYKDKNSNGGRLHAGPAWDYDIAWGNADYCEGSAIDGWSYDFGDVCGGDGAQVPFWWKRMLQDPQFVAELRCRWNDLRGGVLSPPNIDHFCDSVAALLSTAQVRNFTIWPTLGTYVWPNPSPIPSTYAGEVDELKDWAAQRWSWVNANLPGNCTVGMPLLVQATALKVYPAHFIDHITLDGTGYGMMEVILTDVLGAVVLDTRIRGIQEPLRIDLPPSLSAGAYLLHLRGADGHVTTRRLTH
ncbi:MAG: CotH kinase family protein [Flavobacteriales bacterium]|nr:CotH kinase family protein [Flavobacteriales bacterium]